MAYITVDNGEFTYQVWVDDPVPPQSDPELPQPSAPQRVEANSPPPAVPVVPGTLNASGNPQYTAGSPEYFTAAQLAKQESRNDLLRAASDYGVGDFAITAVVGERIFLEIGGGKTVDITNYFEGNQKPPVTIDVSVPTYGTSTVTTPFRTVAVQALPNSTQVVSTSQGSVTVDPNSEVARFLQWQGSQPNPNGSGTIGEVWARQGISNPYGDPRLVSQAQQQIDRADNRTALFNQSGVTPPAGQIEPWNDPNWPAYQGSNREAYALASAALSDPSVRNNLMAQNGWNLATFESWALKSTNPEEAARQARAFDLANGIVAGPGGSKTTLSPNKSTTITTTGAGVNAQGFPGTTFGQVSALNNFNPARDAAYLALFPPTAFSSTPLISSTGSPLPAINDFAVASAENAQSNTAQSASNNIASPANVSQNPYRQSPTATLTAPVNTAPRAQTVPTSGSSAGAPVAIAAAAAAVAAAVLSTGTQTTPVLPLKTPGQVSDPSVPSGLSDEEILARLNPGGLSDEEILARQEAASRQRTQEQATLQARYKQPASSDWRVRLQLAPNADYLYKDRSGSTILAPLYETDGVIFPYTPQIETSYNANYEMYDLTHSNFRGYFYKNSRVNDINIRATFTAQDTQEANYLLAVIHFFRSVTKMFYGAKDAFRGAPPPLTYLSGLGQYQFNQHPCVVSQFNYSLPNDVDYIRAGAPNNYGTNLLTQRARTGAIAPEAGNPSLTRLLGTLTKPPVSATVTPPSPSMINQNVNNLSQATYVPTKIEISLTLLPINTRSQVSTQFNMKDFASGALIKGGFW
jgi:hypothetical protein